MSTVTLLRETLRREASFRWTRTFGSELVNTIPGYFVDRLASRLKSNMSLPDTELFRDIPQYALSRSEAEMTLRTHPLIGDSFPPPVDAKFRLSSWANDLLDAWRFHLEDHGVSVPSGHFDFSQFETLGGAYASSVYFPGPVAIDGPGFLNALGGGAASLVNSDGVAKVIEFSVIMCFIHERTHFLQYGEPLLCEYILSIAWVSYIRSCGLERFQVNPTTQQWATLEEGFHVMPSRILASLGTLFMDTSRIVPILGLNDEGNWYEHLCALATSFENRSLRYSDYLRHLSNDLRLIAEGSASCQSPAFTP